MVGEAGESGILEPVLRKKAEISLSESTETRLKEVLSFLESTVEGCARSLARRGEERLALWNVWKEGGRESPATCIFAWREWREPRGRSEEAPAWLSWC